MRLTPQLSVPGEAALLPQNASGSTCPQTPLSADRHHPTSQTIQPRRCSVITHCRLLWRRGRMGGGSQTDTQSPSLPSASLQWENRESETDRESE